MRKSIVGITAALSLVAAAPAAADPAASAAARIPVTASYDGPNPIYSIARERPAKRYKVTVTFADDGKKVIRRIRSGQRVVLSVDDNVDHLRSSDTTVIRVGTRQYKFQLRCIRKKRSRG